MERVAAAAADGGEGGGDGCGAWGVDSEACRG